MNNHACDSREVEDYKEPNMIHWIYQENGKWYFRWIRGHEFGDKLEIVYCPYCGTRLKNI